LNQEIHTSYKPIWELLAENNIPVGVFGSLQSWPVPGRGRYDFYVPDTFAKDPQTLPAALEAFQRFNLAQTRRDGGVVAKGVSLSFQSIKDIIEMFKNGLTRRTFFVLVRQLIRELLNKNFRNIRSIYQSPVAFDLFFHLLQRTKPAYVSFFTNHAAGMMHRYWKYLYPEDFHYTLKGNDDYFRHNTILRAMEMADEQLKKLKSFADQEGYAILIAASMGQEAIDRGEYLGQLHITNMDKFYEAIEYTGIVKNNLAMSPDFSFEFEDKKDLKVFQNGVLNLTDGNGTPVFGFKESGLTLNINLQTTVKLVKSGGFYRNQKGEKLSFEDLGISIEPRDLGTGYHQPEGIAIFYKKGIVASNERVTIESIEVAPTLLSLFDVPLPDYMKKPVKGILSPLNGVV
jgi:hypothetical protein